MGRCRDSAHRYLDDHGKHVFITQEHLFKTYVLGTGETWEGAEMVARRYLDDHGKHVFITQEHLFKTYVLGTGENWDGAEIVPTDI